MINSDLQELLKQIYNDDILPLQTYFIQEFVSIGPNHKEGDPCIQKLTILGSKTTIIFKGLGYYNGKGKYKRQLIKIE